MAFDALRKVKSVEIALALFKGTKGVGEIRDAVEGSYTTIGKRIEELLNANIIEEVRSKREQPRQRPLPKRVMRLTDDGHKVVDSFIQSGFLNVPLLDKARQRWILLVLRILGVVRGRTRLIKLLFVLKFESKREKEISFKFRPWIYGPYSKDVVDDLEDLRKTGLIYERSEPFRKSGLGEKKVGYIYTLTPTGARLASEFLEKVSFDTVKKLQNLRAFNEMELDKFLRHIYHNYPRFVKYSTIVERVLYSSED